MAKEEAEAFGRLVCSKHLGRCPDDCQISRNAAAWIFQRSTQRLLAPLLDVAPPPTTDWEII